MNKNGTLDLLFGGMSAMRRGTFIAAGAALTIASAASGASLGFKLGANGNGGIQAGFLLPTDLANSVYGNSNNNKPLIYISGLQAWLTGQSLSQYDLILYVDGDNQGGRTGEYWAVNASGPTSGLTYAGDMTTHVFMRDYNNF